MRDIKVNSSKNKIDSIILATETTLRMRKVVLRSNAKVTGKYPAFKGNRMVHWESGLELDAMMRHDANPLILSFSEQPAIIYFTLNGIPHKHYPDLLLKTNNGLIFQEIKTDKKAQQEDIFQRTQFLKEHLPIYGYNYEVVTESYIREEPNLSNAKYLLRHGRIPTTELQQDNIRRYLYKNSFILWGDLSNGIFGSHGKNQTCYLVLLGYLEFNQDEVLSNKTKIRLVENNK